MSSQVTETASEYGEETRPAVEAKPTEESLAQWQEEYLRADEDTFVIPEHERGLSYWGRLFRQNTEQARRRNYGRNT